MDAALSEFVVEHAIADAVAEFRAGNHEAAGLLFWTALSDLDAVEVVGARLRLAGRLGDICEQTGFDDIALFALELAVALAEAGGDFRAMANNGMTLGNIHARLGNLATAEQAWLRVQHSALEDSDYANAASATTNIAGLLADAGAYVDAIEMLDQSLGYLTQESFPHTELNTRLLLVQLLDDSGVGGRVLDVALPVRPLAGQLAPPHRARLAEVVRRALAKQPDRRPQFEWLVAEV